MYAHILSVSLMILEHEFYFPLRFEVWVRGVTFHIDSPLIRRGRHECTNGDILYTLDRRHPLHFFTKLPNVCPSDLKVKWVADKSKFLSDDRLDIQGLNDLRQAYQK